jgi:dipeptidyl aminopeptidase/acylaminoacyl peptidase
MDFSIRRYLNTQMAYAPSFTSDGDHINFITNITGIPQVWRVELPGDDGKPRWPMQLTFGEDRVQYVISSRVPGDDRVIFGRDAGGNENAQLFLLDPATTRETCLTAGHDDAMHIPGEWSKDGRYIIFAANRRNKAIFDLYLHDLETGDDRRLWEHESVGYLMGGKFSPDGESVLMTRLYGNFDRQLFEVDINSGDVRMVSPEEDEVVYGSAQYAPDGQSVLMTTDLHSDFTRITRLDLATAQVKPIYEAHWDVELIELSPNGDYLAYSVNEEGVSKIYLYHMQTGETRRAPLGDVPGVLTFGMRFSEDSSRLTFDYNRATRVCDVYVWHLAEDDMQRVTQSSHGGLPVESFVAPELVHYPTFDEDDSGGTRMIPAWLYRPQISKDEPLPVVVRVHGGPEGQSRPNFDFLAQYLVQAGYAVFVPNVRGSIGYGKAYSHLDDIEKRMDSVADLAHAVYYLREQAAIDDERIAVYGGSYGGFMVLAALTHYPDLWAAGVDIVGISNLATFLENTSDYRRKAREVEYGSLEHDRDFLEQIAPINHIDKVTAPLMVIHGKNDPRVPLSEAEQMVIALDKRDVPVEFMVFDDEGHGVIKLKNKLVMYPAVVKFLDDYLK